MKINLLKRRKHRESGKNLVAMENKVWYISKEQNGTTYYVNGIDQTNRAIKWTPNRSSAMSFRTEGGVYQFIHSHLHDRADIYLVHALEERK